jgi:hypothetical protein
MTEQEFVQRVEHLARRLETSIPRVRVVSSRGREALRIRVSGWTVRVSEKALTDLTEAEIDFGLALAFCMRLRGIFLRPAYVWAPWLVTTFIGFCIVLLGQVSFVDRFWMGFGIMFGSMLVGYAGSILVSASLDDRVLREQISEALSLTGNASAAETYLIRCGTDHLLAARRSLGSSDRSNLDTQLEALRNAASRLGLSYRSVGYFES